MIDTGRRECSEGEIEIMEAVAKTSGRGHLPQRGLNPLRIPAFAKALTTSGRNGGAVPADVEPSVSDVTVETVGVSGA